MPQQSQLNHQHMHGPATIASSSGSNNSIASFQLQLHLGLSIPASSRAKPRPSQTRLGPHAAHAASAIKCKLFHFCANCCATFFSGSVRAHHQKQIIDSSSSKIDSKENKRKKRGKELRNCRNCCSIFAFIDFSCSQRRRRRSSS